MCGAKTKKYSHNLNKGMIDSLKKLYAKNSFTRLADLDLTINQFNNFQKLRYWGLVVNESGKWKHTALAERFLLNKIEIPMSVTTYRKKVVSYSDQKIKSDYSKTKYKSEF
jgi:predicted Zn-dependent protease with MMP-like domain